MQMAATPSPPRSGTDTVEGGKQCAGAIRDGAIQSAQITQSCAERGFEMAIEFFIHSHSMHHEQIKKN
jgi:hypothetical protein